MEFNEQLIDQKNVSHEANVSTRNASVQIKPEIKRSRWTTATTHHTTDHVSSRKSLTFEITSSHKKTSVESDTNIDEAPLIMPASLEQFNAGWNSNLCTLIKYSLTMVFVTSIVGFISWRIDYVVVIGSYMEIHSDKHFHTLAKNTRLYFEWPLILFFHTYYVVAFVFIVVTMISMKNIKQSFIEHYKLLVFCFVLLYLIYLDLMTMCFSYDNFLFNSDCFGACHPTGDYDIYLFSLPINVAANYVIVFFIAVAVIPILFILFFRCRRGWVLLIPLVLFLSLQCLIIGLSLLIIPKIDTYWLLKKYTNWVVTLIVVRLVMFAVSQIMHRVTSWLLKTIIRINTTADVDEADNNEKKRNEQFYDTYKSIFYVFIEIEYHATIRNFYLFTIYSEKIDLFSFLFLFFSHFFTEIVYYVCYVKHFGCEVKLFDRCQRFFCCRDPDNGDCQENRISSMIIQSKTDQLLKYAINFNVAFIVILTHLIFYILVLVTPVYHWPTWDTLCYIIALLILEIIQYSTLLILCLNKWVRNQDKSADHDITKSNQYRIVEQYMFHVKTKKVDALIIYPVLLALFIIYHTSS